MLQMEVIVDTEGPATSVSFGDDVVSVSTHIDGTVDDIKLELELLSAVGEVSKQHCRFVAGKNRVDLFLVPEILCLWVRLVVLRTAGCRGVFFEFLVVKLSGYFEEKSRSTTSR